MFFGQVAESFQISWPRRHQPHVSRDRLEQDRRNLTRETSQDFGDGTRVPMIVVSKFSTGGHIKHTYTDHASVIKFIDANWGLSPITARSRDNLPNPVASDANRYAPVNRPAIGDLMDMFDFRVE